ncbi:magnesium/cobalt transporter CorA [Modestobacter sp. I12A-02628]|uniref:Magnesium transport protein CorA n=1 Tax=Goekera deserti TaxID=2497753 RepID=A0A7K3WI95_9ACTN|nr:magnesium/cobalt transporter CorA [Goekera deserti]MPQ99403.1 magnesium/cobalt transporter CorA [Goekera deserti]NDI48890.1 magnesium/cobalt transporter CorA [Goekera deserti]NEL55639.1 magnesium/cobalt transporter CorA [Goekera deserti]
MTSTDRQRGPRIRVPRAHHTAEQPPVGPTRSDTADAVIDCAVYVDGQRQPPVEPVASLERARAVGGFVWLGLHEPSQAEFETFASRYGLHPLAVEDAVNAHQRPKLERYDDSLFMVLKTARYVEHDQLTATSEVVDTGEVMVFVGPEYVITVRHGEHSGLKELRAGLERQPDMLRQGPSSVLYAVADLVVDHFVETVAAVEEDVEELEASVFSPDRTDDIGRIYQLKRELMQLRRALNPLEGPLTALAERQVEQVPEQMRSYFRDVQDHAVRVREQLTAYDELLASILQASLARTSLADNEDMRKISAYAGIIAVPTAIAGVYGMNFDYMPELRWHYGYPLVVLVMVLACLGLYRAFKRSGWL